MSKQLGFCAALLIGTLVPSAASAQGWLADRSRAEGPGFRVGDFELHPGLGIEIGYDSNLYYSDDLNRLMNRRDSGILRAAAHLLFASRGAQRAAEGESGGAGQGGLPAATFRGGLSGTFYHFFNDESRTNMEADASLALNILPGRTFSLALTDTFGRSIRPFTESSVSQSYARLQNDAGVMANFQTDGGVLKVSFGYNFVANFFEDQLFSYANRLEHRLMLRETFRFLPQTALIHDTTFRATDVLNEGTAIGPLLNDGFMVRSRIGINGAFTTDFSVLVMVGYSAGFFNTRTTAPMYDQDYESLSAQVEARWQILEGTSLTFGYDRDFQPSYIGNFYRRDRGQIAFQTIIDGSFLLGANFSAAYLEFGRIVNVDGTMLGETIDRGDIRLTGSLFAEYRFTQWLGVNGTFVYNGNITDYVYDLDPSASRRVDPAQFNKVELWAGVRVFY